ncbi:hypothetical protein WHI96_16470 [Pseudonocardia tropica]|uniref:Uncharacterized protein n=1 Tax=Pseudonocardia tropica TaxID=681289 RepID=A0ABV1JWS3_9PSEU
MLVHACIGAIRSTLFLRTGPDQHRLVGLLGGPAHGLLGVDPVRR